MANHVKIFSLRFYIGCFLIAANNVFVEKQAHIASGGVSALSIGLAEWLHTSIGIINLIIKIFIFCFVYCFGGQAIALSTMIGATITAVSMRFFELIPFAFNFPMWIFFLWLLIFSKLPMGLLVSKGYSTGGYTSVAQILWHRRHIPLWASLTSLNAFSITIMFVVSGSIAGILTAILSLSSGFFTEWWGKFFTSVLDQKTVSIPKKTGS